MRDRIALALAVAALLAVVGCTSQLCPDGGGDGGGGATSGTGTATIGTAGGRLFTPDFASLPGQARLIMSIPAGQLASSYTFTATEVPSAAAPPMPAGTTAVGSPWTISASASAASAKQVPVTEMTWTFTYAPGELAAANAYDRRDALKLYVWDSAASEWDIVLDSLSRSAADPERTSVFGTFSASFPATVCVGLPPYSLSPTFASLTASALAVDPGDSVTLQASATDPLGGAVTYQWWADAGEIAASGGAATWTAPSGAGPATVTCVATSEVGGVGAENIQLISRWPETPVTSVSDGLCVICFDDGNASDWQAFDYMYRNYGMKATCYIQSSRLGTAFAATPAQYRAMLEAGWEMGNHTTTGVSLSTATGAADAKIATYVTPAQTDIQTALGAASPPASFAAPMGHWGATQADENSLTEALLTTFGSIRGTYATHYQLPPQDLDSTHGTAHATTRRLDAWSIQSNEPLSVAVAKHLVDLAADSGGLAVIHTHRVMCEPGDWSQCTPTAYDLTWDAFTDFIDYVAQSGLRTVTMSELYELEPLMTGGPVVVDGDFTRMAELWPEMGSYWPGGGSSPWFSLHYPYQPAIRDSSVISIDTSVGHNAAGSCRINGTSATAARRLIQPLFLEPGAQYRVSGWIRTEGLSGGLGASLMNVGAAASQLQAPASPLSGTNGWTYVEGTFTSGSTGEDVERTHLWLNVDATSGSAWFDDIAIAEVG